MFFQTINFRFGLGFAGTKNQKFRNEPVKVDTNFQLFFFVLGKRSGVHGPIRFSWF